MDPRKCPYGPRPDLQEQLRQFRSFGVHGWCSPEKAMALVRIVTEHQPDFCVEIGVFGGASLIPIGLALREVGRGVVVGIDPWDSNACLEGMIEKANLNWWSTVDLASVRRSCEEHIIRLDLRDYVRLMQERAEKVTFNTKIGLLHIDGNHSEESSLRDVRKWLPEVLPGGHVVLDDADWTEGGVRTQVKSIELLAKECSLVRTVDGDRGMIFKKE